MLSCEKKRNRSSDIKLPNQDRIVMTNPLPIRKVSSGDLGQMNNFDPPFACTPPDKGFMENLMRRMERT